MDTHLPSREPRTAVRPQVSQEQAPSPGDPARRCVLHEPPRAELGKGRCLTRTQCQPTYTQAPEDEASRRLGPRAERQAARAEPGGPRRSPSPACLCLNSYALTPLHGSIRHGGQGTEGIESLPTR